MVVIMVITSTLDRTQGGFPAGDPRFGGIRPFCRDSLARATETWQRCRTGVTACPTTRSQPASQPDSVRRRRSAVGGRHRCCDITRKGSGHGDERRISWRTAMTRALSAGAVIAVMVVAAPATPAQHGVPANPPLTIRSMAGSDLFAFYCATCHGTDAKGNGPVAAALKRPPPDLTRLALLNGGSFPRQRVETYVTNDGDTITPAHGSSEMPVWGPVFRGLDPSDTLVRVRIANVVGYVESIQAKE
jgi:mono/diheme cytochrome c family protein